MRVTAIVLDQSLSGNVLPVTIGDVLGVTFGNSGFRCWVLSVSIGVGLWRLSVRVLLRHTHSVGADWYRDRLR